MTANKIKSGFSAAIRLLLAVTVTCCFSACSSDLSDTARQLLETVPATASNVMVYNLPMFAESAGNKASDNPGCTDTHAQSNIDKTSYKTLFCKTRRLIYENPGCERSVLVVFWYGGQPVITGIIDDTSEFKSFAKKSQNKDFTEINGVSVCGKYAIKGNQFWIFNNNAIVDNVNEWSKLSKHQNYLSNKNAEQLTECKYAVAGLLDIMATLNTTGGDFKQAATRQMILSALFDDAQFLSYNIELKKSECIINADVINSKGHTAAINLPLDKIKSSDIESLDGTANMFAAININQKMIEKINNMLKQVGGLPTSIEQLVGGINGTCVMKGNSIPDGMIRIPVTNNETAGLTELLGVDKSRQVVYKDNMLTIEPNAPIAGKIQAKEAAKALNGAYLGLVAIPASLGDFNQKGISKITFTVVPDNAGVRIRITLTASNPKQKFLEQIL